MGGRDAAAQGIVRDAEIENIIREYAAPLLNVAGIDKEAFHVHLINSREINAFVANGQRLYITTGLLRRSEGPGQIIGVMAHEMGHIAGGHLARLRGAIDKASNAALISQLIGVAVGVLAGQPGAVAAIGGGGSNVAQRSLLSFSRGQEQAADQAAARYLDAAGISGRPLVKFMEILEQQEFLQSNRQDPYLLTHPLTRERLEFMRNHVAHSPASNRKLPAKFVRDHKRIVAKLDGFLDTPGNTLAKYPAKDKSVPARYARSIAFYREAELDKALPLIDGLIKDEPTNPYFRELKGQMLFENGRLAEALPVYRQAVRLAPSEPLLRTALAHVQIEMNDPDLLADAMRNLDNALRVDRFYPLAWRLAAIAQGRRGDLGESALALAEYNILIGRKADAKGQAHRAMRLMKEGSPGWVRAQDIVVEASHRER